MADSEVTLLSRPGCHLCDDARAVVRGVLARLGAAGVPVRFTERSILDDAELEEQLHDDIPVVLVNGTLHARWRVDADRLTAELTPRG